MSTDIIAQEVIQTIEIIKPVITTIESNATQQTIIITANAAPIISILETVPDAIELIEALKGEQGDNGIGDMLASVYDPIIASKVDDTQVLTDVPVGAIFTDTVYEHPANHAISVITGLQSALDGKVDDGQVLTDVPAGAVFTDTIYVQTDVITIPQVATPTTPAAGNISVFARKRAGRILPAFINDNGMNSNLQPAFFGNNIYMWTPANTTTVSIAFGTTWTARNTTGAQATPTKATTNFLTQMSRATFSSTAATATASGIQSTHTVGVRGNAAGIGGFYAFFRFGVETLSGTGQQLLVGLTAGLNGVFGVEPSTLLNSIALTKDSGETTWQVLTRDGSATVTKYDTGETVTAGYVYDLHIYCKPNDTKVTIRLVRENDGTVILNDQEFSTTLPVATTFMYAHAHLRNTGTAINALALSRIYVETDF